MSAEQHFSVGQVASRTQVSVRTLHHYDDIGLLHPSMRLESGRRLYSSADLLKLQQILTMRYLGFELRQIGELLERPDFDILASLRIQRKAVRDRIEQLQRIDAGLARLLDGRIANGVWDWNALADASAAVQEKGPTMDEYYTPEQIRQHTDELARGGRGEELHALEREWRLLLRDMHANPDLPRESRIAAEFVDRWDDIHERARPLFQGDTKLWHLLGRAHLDGQYDSIEDASHSEDYAFIRRVKEATAK